MKKNRTLVLALSLSVGLLGIGATPSVDAPLPTPPSTEAPLASPAVVEAPSNGNGPLDVSGSGPWWKKWACITCFGVGIGVSAANALVGGIVVGACARACF